MKRVSSSRSSRYARARRAARTAARRRRRTRPRAGSPRRRQRRSRSAAFRAGVDLVSLNVTVTDGAEPLRHRPRAGRLLGLRGRRQAGRHVLQPHATADRAVAAARHQRQHGSKLPTLQEAADRLRHAGCKPQDLAEVIDFDSRVVFCRPSPTTQRELEHGDPADLGRRLDLAVQRDLHRAEGSEEGQSRQRRGNPPPGDRRPLRRRRHVEPAAVRRSARPRQALRDGDLRDRPARRRHRRRKGFKEAEFVLRQLAQETGGRAFFPAQIDGARRRLRPDRRRALQPVHASATPRGTRGATAPGAASSSGWTGRT